MGYMHIFIWAVMILLGLSAVFALAWSLASGQLRDFQSGARSIFDEEEPVGTMTDAFPGEAPDARPEEDAR